MTEISKEWCINMAKQEEGDIGAGKLAIDPTSDKFHKLALNESFERVAKVAEERQAFNEAMALREENERLRALLARTVNLAEVYAEGTGTNFKEAMAEARAALQEQSK